MFISTVMSALLYPALVAAVLGISTAARHAILRARRFHAEGMERVSRMK